MLSMCLFGEFPSLLGVGDPVHCCAGAVSGSLHIKEAEAGT